MDATLPSPFVLVVVPLLVMFIRWAALGRPGLISSEHAWSDEVGGDVPVVSIRCGRSIDELSTGDPMVPKMNCSSRASGAAARTCWMLTTYGDNRTPATSHTAIVSAGTSSTGS